MNQLIARLGSAGYELGLREDQVVLNYVGKGKPDSIVDRPLIEEARARKAELRRRLKKEAMIATNIGQTIRRARDWQDLSVIWPHMDVVLTMGNLTAEEHGSLLSRLKARSRELPETAGSVDHSSSSGRATAPPLPLATLGSLCRVVRPARKQEALND